MSSFKALAQRDNINQLAANSNKATQSNGKMEAHEQPASVRVAIPPDSIVGLV